jgi:hypothetical protein
MAKRAAGAPRKRARADWNEARRLYEVEGKFFSEIAEIVGCQPHTVGRRAKREHWINRQQIISESTAARQDEIWRRFVERDAEAVTESLVRGHRINGRIQAELESRLDLVQADHSRLLAVLSGQAFDPITKGDVAEMLVRALRSTLELRRIGLTNQTVLMGDRAIAGLKDDGWRSETPKDGEADGEAAALDAALGELEEG